jgi:hypothetical protein
VHTRGSYKDVVFYTPKLSFLNIRDLVYPSVFTFPLLEEANIDYGYDDNMFKESLLIDWLQLLANIMIMYIDFRTLSLIHQVSYFSIF